MDRRAFVKTAAVGAAGCLLGSGSRFFVPMPAFSATFSDIPSDHWLITDGILDFVTNHEILHGSNGLFRPEEPVLREEAATVLFNAFDGPPSSDQFSSVNTTGLSDVQTNQYYTLAANWAVATKVMGGYVDPDGVTRKFGVGDPVTREQLACMLRNAVVNVFGSQQLYPIGNLRRFKDSADISPWALESLAWAVGCGIMSGHNDTLLPKGVALRSHIAKMIYLTLLWVDPQRRYTNFILTPNFEDADFIGYEYANGCIKYYKNPGKYSIFSKITSEAKEENSDASFYAPQTADSADVIEPYSVIGPDDRKLVTITTSFPHSAIGYLEALSSSAGNSGRGTAAFISYNSAVTAAHNLIAENGEFRERVVFAPGLNDPREPFSRIDAVCGFIDKNYLDSLSDKDDFAFLVFHKKPGRKTGYLGTRNAFSFDQAYTISGYPYEAHGITDDLHQWTASGNLLNATDTLLTHDIDTSEGNSGSPLYYPPNHEFEYKIIGIHKGAVHNKPVNVASRLTSTRGRAVRALRVNGEKQ